MPNKEIQPFKVLAVLFLSCCPVAAAETQIAPEPTVAPSFTAEQPANPVSSKPGGPLIVSVSVSLPPQGGILVPQIPRMIIPQFHFIAPNGNAVVLHSDLVETDGNNFHLTPSVAINVPAEAQKRGAVITHGMTCGQAPFYATMAAYVMDADGNRSNSVRYTLHCNGG